LVHGRENAIPFVSLPLWLSTIIAIAIFLFKKGMGLLKGVLVAFAINAVPYLALGMLGSGEVDGIITLLVYPHK
jgi:hypothetical protein